MTIVEWAMELLVFAMGHGGMPILEMQLLKKILYSILFFFFGKSDAEFAASYLNSAYLNPAT